MRNKLHQVWDFGALITILSMAITGIWYYSYDHTRLDFLADQIIEMKNTQSATNAKIEGIDLKVDHIFELLSRDN